MEPKGLMSLIQLIDRLAFRYVLTGHGSFKVTHKRKDKDHVWVTVEHGDHSLFLIGRTQAIKWLQDRPDIAEHVADVLIEHDGNES